jgi:hypothetical protein
MSNREIITELLKGAIIGLPFVLLVYAEIVMILLIGG